MNSVVRSLIRTTWKNSRISSTSTTAPFSTTATFHCINHSNRSKSEASLNQSINHRVILLTSAAGLPVAFSRGVAGKAGAETPAEGGEPEIPEEHGGSQSGTRRPSGEERDPKDRTRLVTWETSARYLKSEAYRKTYGNDPVWKSYRRQHKGLHPPQYTRKSCIKGGLITIGSPCPGCRDEYLVFDYRNTDLLKQFVSPFTGDRLNHHVIGLCRAKRQRLDLELEKARHFGTMSFKVPFRHYNYEDYYGTQTPTKINSAEQ